MLYCCLYCCFCVAVLVVVAGVQSSLLSRCIVVFFSSRCASCSCSCYCCRWCAVSVFFLCRHSSFVIRRSSFVVIRLPPSSLLHITAYCCFVLFRVVSCCFVLFRVVSCCFVLFRVVSCCFVLLLLVTFLSMWLLCLYHLIFVTPNHLAKQIKSLRSTKKFYATSPTLGTSGRRSRTRVAHVPTHF